MAFGIQLHHEHHIALTAGTDCATSRHSLSIWYRCGSRNARSLARTNPPRPPTPIKYSLYSHSPSGIYFLIWPAQFYFYFTEPRSISIALRYIAGEVPAPNTNRVIKMLVANRRECCAWFSSSPPPDRRENTDIQSRLQTLSVLPEPQSSRCNTRCGYSRCPTLCCSYYINKYLHINIIFGDLHTQRNVSILLQQNNIKNETLSFQPRIPFANALTRYLMRRLLTAFVHPACCITAYCLICITMYDTYVYSIIAILYFTCFFFSLTLLLRCFTLHSFIVCFVFCVISRGAYARYYIIHGRNDALLSQRQWQQPPQQRQQ